MGEWLLGGDSNAVRVEVERKGVSCEVNRRELVEFNLFIENMELVNPSVIGKRFS